MILSAIQELVNHSNFPTRVGLFLGLLATFGAIVSFIVKVALGGRVKGLPGVPFKFPNGQGTEKFFDGRRAARKWRSQYGSMYTIWSGLRQEVVLTNPEQVQKFYKDSHLHTKATDNNSGWLFGELLGRCVGLVSQEQWRKVRKPFDTHFTRPSSILRTKTFIREASDFVQGLTASQNVGGSDDLVIHVTDDLKYCPFFMVATIFFGRLSKDQRRELYQIGPEREALFRETFQGGINRYAIAKYFPGSALPRLRRFQKRWEAFVARAYRRAQNESDIGAAIQELWKAMDHGEFSMAELLQTLDESLFANLDVTAHAVSWNVLRIAEHASIQADIRREIQAKNSDLYEDYLCQEDSLLAACILETSRLHPILPFSNPESALVDKVIDGHVIPKNTDVIVDAFAINVDNPYWVDSHSYNPYRHMGEKDQARRYNMWRFGFGPRQCLGKNVADIILRVIVGELVKNYELVMWNEDKGSTDGIDLQADSWIGLPDGRVKLTPLMSH